MKQHTLHKSKGLYPNKKLLLFPDAAEGSVLEAEGKAGQPSLTQAAEQPMSIGGEPPSDTDLTATMQTDWSKLEGKKEPNFSDSNAPENKVEKKQDDTKQTGEEKEEKVEGEVKQPEIKAEEQVDDKGDGNRKVEGELEKEAELNKEQQTEANPIDERFPEARIFRKKMSEDARKYFDARLADVIEKETQLEETTKALADAESGVTQIPKSYYDNPAAIVLVPEFQRATSHVNIAAKIAQHWDSQMGLIMRSEPWRKLEYIKDAEGNVVDVKPTEAEFEGNRAAEYEVGKYVRNSEGQLQQMQTYQQQLQQAFSKRVQERIALVREAENKFFDPKTWEDKKHPNYALTEQVKKGLYSIGFTEGNPGFNLMAKMGAEIMRLRSYASHKDKVAVKNGVVEGKAKAAGLNGKDTKGAGGSENPAEDDVMGAFNKVLINR